MVYAGRTKDKMKISKFQKLRFQSSCSSFSINTATVILLVPETESIASVSEYSSHTPLYGLSSEIQVQHLQSIAVACSTALDFCIPRPTGANPPVSHRFRSVHSRFPRRGASPRFAPSSTSLVAMMSKIRIERIKRERDRRFSVSLAASERLE